MANLGALAGVPFLGGYLAQGEANRAEQAQQQEQQIKSLAMLAKMQEMKSAQDQRVREESFRASLAGLGPDATDEQIAQLGLRSGALGAKDAVSIAQTAASRKAAMESNKQMALARLNQDFTLKSENLRVAQRNASTAEQKLALDQYAKQLSAWHNQAAIAIQSGRLAYETGSQPIIPDMPTAPAPTAAPVASPAAPQQQVIRQDMQSEDDARNTALALAAQGLPVAIRGPETQAAPAPAAAPVTPSVPPVTSANMDPRDFKAATPTAAPVAPVTPATPAAPDPMAGLDALKQQAWFKDMPPKAQNDWVQKYALQQTKPSIAGQGTFTPQALEFVAKQYLSGDRQAAQGFARNATARIALQNAIVDEAMKQGMSPEQAAAKMAEYAGVTAASRSLGQRSATIGMYGTEAVQMMDIVKEQSDKFGRSDFIPWNMALRAYETNTGSPEVAAFGAAVNTLINAYARAINPTGQTTDSDKKHAREVISTIQSPAQVDAVLNIMRREMEIARNAPRNVKESVLRDVIGEGKRTNIDVLLEKYK